MPIHHHQQQQQFARKLWQWHSSTPSAPSAVSVAQILRINIFLAIFLPLITARAIYDPTTQQINDQISSSSSTLEERRNEQQERHNQLTEEGKSLKMFLASDEEEEDNGIRGDEEQQRRRIIWEFEPKQIIGNGENNNMMPSDDNANANDGMEMLRLVGDDERSATSAAKRTIPASAITNDINGNKKGEEGEQTAGRMAPAHADLFTRMRSICAKMPRLKRKRTPRPGSPESLVAFLCSNTNIF